MIFQQLLIFTQLTGKIHSSHSPNALNERNLLPSEQTVNKILKKQLITLVDRTGWSKNQLTVLLTGLVERFKNLICRRGIKTNLHSWSYTDKKENQIFLIYCIRKSRVKQLQSHTWLTASSYMGKFFFAFPHILGSPSSYIYDFATAPLWISQYVRKFYFIFYQCTADVWLPYDALTNNSRGLMEGIVMAL